ncbi:hypothetical protein BH09VER1_BH09VER1_55250 [soil metagenome]
MSAPFSSLPRPNQPEFLSLEDMASRVQSGQRIAVGGALFYRLPIALVKAVIARRIRDLEYVSWSGGLPLEMLLAAGAVRKIRFCFSSLDIFGLAPLFRRALEEKSVEAEDWTAISLISALKAAQHHLPSAPIRPAPASDVYARSGYAVAYRDPITGEELAAVPALPVDSCLLHASRADEDGNIEIIGSRHLDESMMGAAQQVLATVEEIVPRGGLGTRPGSLIWPRRLVAAIALSPGGAYPTSCPNYYVTDYRALQRITATSPPRVFPPDPDRFQFLQRAARVIPSKVTSSALLLHRQGPPLDAPVTIDEIMAVWLARQFDDETICSVGAVSPLAFTAYLLAKRHHAPGLTILPANAGCVDIAFRPMMLALGESLDTQSAVYYCGGDDAWHRFYLHGFITHEVVSSAQIDKWGRSNTIEIRAAGKTVRLPGQGGMAEVADVGQHFILYHTRHSPRSLVEKVDVVSAARTLLTDQERLAAGLKPGRVQLVTDLGVFAINPESREFELSSLHPGVELEKVRAETGFPFPLASDFGTTLPPTEEELRLLRAEVDPLGIRRLEFIPSKDRAALLEELLSSEDAVIHELLPEQG